MTISLKLLNSSQRSKQGIKASFTKIRSENQKKFHQKEREKKKIVLQLLEIIQTILLEKSVKILAKSSAIAGIRRAITPKIIQNLNQKTSCNFGSFYINDYYFGS